MKGLPEEAYCGEQAQDGSWDTIRLMQARSRVEAFSNLPGGLHTQPFCAMADVPFWRPLKGTGGRRCCTQCCSSGLSWVLRLHARCAEVVSQCFSSICLLPGGLQLHPALQQWSVLGAKLSWTLCNSGQPLCNFGFLAAWRPAGSTGGGCSCRLRCRGSRSSTPQMCGAGRTSARSNRQAAKCCCPQCMP